MLSYPQDFPIAESIELVQILRQNKAKEKLPILARHIWTLQGYAMKTAIGDPDNPAVTTTPITPGPTVNLPTIPNIPDLSLFSVKPENFDALDQLEKLNEAVTNNTVQAQVAVPWQLILTWALQELVELVTTATA